MESTESLGIGDRLPEVTLTGVVGNDVKTAFRAFSTRDDSEHLEAAFFNETVDDGNQAVA